MEYTEFLREVQQGLYVIAAQGDNRYFVSDMEAGVNVIRYLPEVNLWIDENEGRTEFCDLVGKFITDHHLQEPPDRLGKI